MATPTQQEVLDAFAKLQADVDAVIAATRARFPAEMQPLFDAAGAEVAAALAQIGPAMVASVRASLLEVVLKGKGPVGFTPTDLV